MNDNRFSTELTPEDVLAIRAALTTIRTKLPFLVDLSLEERKAMLRTTTDVMPFLVACQDFCVRHPECIPAGFSVPEYDKDVALIQSFAPSAKDIKEAGELVDDTLKLLLAEAYIQALSVYRMAKALNRTGELETFLGPMGKRFARTAKPVPAPAPTPTPPPPTPA